ncbi:MAG: (2Fe-2S) ferredoxin domain-containing protein [Leptolyngbyaceae cyanobacterium SM1_1_3]|nr:(2Fe-2S) ferredoxin domain-containing protein [Leptolyngbyaceae cyanobacterium SM1_1_3]NJN01440.1 (2Fe-2S) ferredoxin domain-containing protein [Leptolyngbyaceae cyanobacterium RM1_1_2]NJO09549.1 (2Fe-2S) ferredoxin domain-containing protein [Leptolyngbyaceae cyanobacterium SL_1_1]
MKQCVLVCQNTSCRQYGSAQVLRAFQQANVEVRRSGCLGQCGNGPMVLVLPDEFWYDRVSPSQVPMIAEQHRQQGCPVRPWLYPKFHPDSAR